MSPALSAWLPKGCNALTSPRGGYCGELCGASFGAARRTVIDGHRMHLRGRQLLRNHPHLFVDVVQAHAFGEGPELAFDVLAVLAVQRRRPKLLCIGAMTGGARRDPARGITGKDQADTGI